MKKLACTGVVAILLVVASAGLWHHLDRSGFLGSLCRAGLPNLSRPAWIDRERLGCTILSTRIRMSGTLLSAFEAANFTPDSLPPAPTIGDISATWFTWNEGDPGREELDRQLLTRLEGLCGTGLAQVTFDGWITVTPGRFGHLGVYSREVFADRIIAVAPPPRQLVERMRREWAETGIGECESGSTRH